MKKFNNKNDNKKPENFSDENHKFNKDNANANNDDIVNLVSKAALGNKYVPPYKK